MSDQNFKVKNGLNLGSSGVIDYNSATSKLRFSNDGGSTFSDLGSGGSQVNARTASYTLALADANNIVEMNVGSANTVTVPGDSFVNFPVGSRVDVVQVGAGQTEFVSGSGPSASNGVDWTTQTSNFGITTISSVAFGNNTWVAVGYSGQLCTSTNAVTWVTQTSNFGTTNINSVAFGNNLWVAAGNTGQLRTSTDAVTWVTRTSNFGSTNINSVTFGNNTWVAVGDVGQLRTSTDAVTWVTQNSNFGTTIIRSIAYGNTWVAGGSSGQLRTSTDAVTWVTQTSNFGTTQIRSVAFGNGTWIVVGYSGQIRTSTDAITWVTQNSNFGTTVIRSVAFGNNLWVVGGLSGQIRTSTDAITWVTQTSNFGTTVIQSVAFGNNLWVAGSESGQLRTSPGITETVSVLSSASAKISERYGTVSLYKRAANTWVLEGDLADEPQTKTASYTLALADAESTIKMDVGSANTVTIPLDSTVNFPVGSLISIIQQGAGQTEIVATSGVTLLSKNSSRRISVRYGTASLYKRAANTWVLFGDLGA